MAPMTFEDTPEIVALRERVRTIIAEQLSPEFLRTFVASAEWQETANEFCRRLASDRLLTFAWPEEYGGAGATIWEQTALREEFWAHHEPRGAQYMGVNWVGPTIMHFGTPAQKQLHLPAIASGDVVWCQGFSEPEAGSDLSSLKLSAARQDNGTFLANGQKIWTSYAGFADWCFLTTRTDRTARKRDGITVFLVPMDRGGISVRPIDSIMGPNHLNEVFFNDVVLQPDEVLGPVNRGWDVIELVLKYERAGVARYARSDKILSDLWQVVQSPCGPGASELRGSLARALVKARIARLLAYRVVGGEPGGTPPQPSAARIATTLLDQEVAELAMDSLGADALDANPELPLGGAVEGGWRYARTATIAGGTTEIQRLLLSRSLTAGTLSDHRPAI
jgi:alkylation response protein AidB-like acyl-CoA dehydrogenase